MQPLKISFAIIIGKTIFLLSRLFGQGGGTAAPGLIALKIYPRLLSYFSSQFKKGTILITGTNGKTTTARLITHLLKSKKISFLHNRTGSNLARGLVSTCLQASSFSGKINQDFGVFEIDEAAFGQLAPQLNPSLVIILNLFRDQLDRYGEIDQVLTNWQKALKTLAKKTIIILNSDDPSVASLGQKTKQKVIYFGLRDKKFSQVQPSHASDATFCPRCLASLVYQHCYISHLGLYQCPNCGRIQPRAKINCQTILKASLDSTLSFIKTAAEKEIINLPLPGTYNLYNLLAAVTSLNYLNISLSQIKKAVKQFQPPFGRVERIKTAANKFIQIFLVKNPAGFNEVLRTLKNNVKKPTLLIAINDLIADGQDISWLWDVDFEEIVKQTKKIVFSGLRAEDMALRWQYAKNSKGKEFQIEKNYSQAIKQELKMIEKGETLFILPTYTAMLAIRKTLYKMGYVHETWKD